MKTQDAIDHYGSISALCDAIRPIKAITVPAVHQWGEYPPPARQLQIERATGSALKAEADCLEQLTGLA